MNTNMDIGSFMDEHHIRTSIDATGFFEAGNMDIEEEKPVEKKEAKAYEFADWKVCVGRDLMAGKHSREIKSKFKVNMRVANKEAKIDKYLSACDGLVGSVLVDCSVFNKQFGYDKVSAKLKKYNKYAIHCACGHEHITSSMKNSADGGIDGFLNNPDEKITEKKAYCKVSGLPVISSIGEIEPTVLASVVDELVASGDISSTQGKNLKASKNLLRSIKEVFANEVGAYKVKKSSTKVEDFERFALQSEELTAETIKKGEVLAITPLTPVVIDDIGEVKNNVVDMDADFNQNEECCEVDNVFDTVPVKGNIEVDSDVYVDNDWFESSELEVKKFDEKPKKEIAISSNFSFDF